MMKWKQLVCLLTSAALICGLCGCGGGGSAGTAQEAGTEAAEPEVPVTKAAPYTPAESFAGGSGTEADPYQISTAEELALLQAQMEASSEYMDKAFVLTADIAFNDVSDFDNWGTEEPAYRWVSIPRFSGSFDGGGHSISGLYLFAAGEDCDGLGLFKTVYGGTIKDLRLTQTYLFADSTGNTETTVGCLAGSAIGPTVENCTVEGVIRAQNFPYYLGGIVGSVQNSRLQNCQFSGAINGQGVSGTLGGVVGTMSGFEGGGVMTGCSSQGTLTFQDGELGTVGGVAGSAGEGCVLQDCVNRMNLSGKASHMGGVAGRASLGYESILENDEWVYRDGVMKASGCRNEGSVENLAEGGETGGVIGMVFNMDARANSLTLSAMSNTGAVTGTENVGGIIGEMNSGYALYSLEDFENQGAITGEEHVGGVLGFLNSGVDGCRIANFTNSGAVTAKVLVSKAGDTISTSAGGVIGAYQGISTLSDRPEGRLTIGNCANTGSVEVGLDAGSISKLGGILGSLFMDSEEETVLLTGCENQGSLRCESTAWMGGITGGAEALMLGGGWTVRNCRNSGTLSFGSGTRDFAQDASLETEILNTAAVDPTSMSQEDYQASVMDRLSKTLGGSCVGGIVGKLWLCTVENCTAEGTILLDEEKGCFAGGICGQFYNNADGANGSAIRDCQYRKEWPYPAMPGIGGVDYLPENTIVNVTGSL